MRKIRLFVLFAAVIVIASVLFTSCIRDSSSNKTDEKTTAEAKSPSEGDGKGDGETEAPEGKKDASPETRGEESDDDPESDETAKAPETVPVETEHDGKREEDYEPSASGTGEAALKLAKNLIGTKFKLGGTGPDEFDNSGFIYYIFKESGVTVPRLARDMPAFGKAIARNDIAPGDILVFANEIGGGPEFEGIYVGNGEFIACFNPDKPTQQAPIGNYWEARFITARRAG